MRKSNRTGSKNNLKDAGSLLREEEQKQLGDLLKILDRGSITPETVKDVLPEAIILKDKEGTQLSKALVEPTEKAVKQSTERDSNVLAEALFPVIGPAIRKALAKFMRETIQSMNRSLEKSLSFKSIKWRIESIKTGKSFAEIALKESIVFRVEEVFLIHRKSGILLNRVVTENSAVSDGDMVAAMLNAVQDFIKDSLNLSKRETVDSFEVGDFVIWIEQSPFAVLALVIQGTPTPELRWKMQDVLETIHLKFGHYLENFDGEIGKFKGTESILTDCLEVELKGSAKKFPKALVAILVLFLGIAGFFVTRSALEGMNGKKALDLLSMQPGIVITETYKSKGKIHINGLRDPLSEKPLAIIIKAGLPLELFSFEMKPYVSLEPQLVLKRAKMILKPPDDVELSFKDGILYATGNVTEEWIDRSRLISGAIPGVFKFNISGLSNEYYSAVKELERLNVYFTPGSANAMQGEEETIVRAANIIKKLIAMYKGSLVFTVTGHTTGQITDAQSLALSIDRAKRVVEKLVELGIPNNVLIVRGVGSDEPIVIEKTKDDMRKNRRVSFSVIELK